MFLSTFQYSARVSYIMAVVVLVSHKPVSYERNTCTSGHIHCCQPSIVTVEKGRKVFVLREILSYRLKLELAAFQVLGIFISCRSRGGNSNKVQGCAI